MPENNPEISKDATGNPLAEHLSITVSLPDTIEIKMVDARVLEDYEIWFFLSSLLFGAVIGFGVPFCQSLETSNGSDTSKGSDTLLGVITAVWAVLFVVCLIVALNKRHILKSKSKVVPFKATRF